MLAVSGVHMITPTKAVTPNAEKLMKDKSQISLHVEEHGAGRPVIFLHGFGVSTYSWRHLVAPLSRQHKLILIDLKGFGKSPKPKDGRYGIQDQAELVYQFIIRHDLNRLTLVGHSMGGGVALVTAIKLLEREPKRLASLVLIDSAAYRQDLPSFIDILRTPVVGPLAFSLLSDKKKVRMILEKAYYDDKRITKEQINAYAKPLSSPGGEYALIKTARKMIPRNIDEITAKYKNIAIPTLILWGRQDKIVPLKFGKKLNQDIPNSHLVIIDKCGHMPHEEKPEESLRAISTFLKNHSTP
jgi:pimeloyl-ACP methyl ester carboxylesterase